MSFSKNSNFIIKHRRIKNGIRGTDKVVGASPDSVNYVGRDNSSPIKIDIINYGKSGFAEHTLSRVSDIKKYIKKTNTNWIDIVGVHDVKLLKEIGQLFEIHSLTLEDIVNTTQRPKIEDHGKYIFIVLKIAYFSEVNEINNKITIEQIGIVANKKNILTFQESESNIFDPLRKRICKVDETVRSFKSDFLLYEIIDSIADHYFVILEKYEDDIEYIEDLLIRDSRHDILNDIYQIKKELTVLRKSIWPSRDIVNNLLREDYGLITKPVEMYFKDVYDHIVQIVETIETMRDISNGMLDLYLSTVSNKMNEVMKVLTMFSSIFIPLTFIVGVYGMNFKYMPELGMRWAYFVVWGVIIIVVLIIFIFFKKKKWM